MIYMVNKTLNRYCLLYFDEDLLNDYYFCIISGKLDSSKSTQKITSYNSKIAASQQMFDIECLKLKQGYVYSDILSEDSYSLTPEVI